MNEEPAEVREMRRSLRARAEAAEARLREYEEKLAHYGDAEAISIVRRRSAGGGREAKEET